MSFRHLLPLAIVISFIACGGDDSGDDDDDDKPTRDSGSGSGVGTGGETGDDGGDEGGDDGGDDGGETGGESGGETGDETFRPEAGTWSYTGGNILSDGCNTDELGGGEPAASNFELTHTAEGAFVMKYDTGDPWRCELTDQAYSCEAVAGSAPVDDYDVTLDSYSTHTGSFDTEVDMYGEFSVTVDCSGSDCTLAEWFYDLDFPCTVVFDATASYSG